MDLSNNSMTNEEFTKAIKNGDLTFDQRSGKYKLKDTLIMFSKPKDNSNKRVKNATKIMIDGIKFDSKLESYMYERFVGFKVPFEFQYKFELMPKFTFDGETVRAMKTIVDFWIPDLKIVVDTKGWGTDVSKIKMKLFKYRIEMGDYDIKSIRLPSNQKACLGLAIELKSMLNELT